jgi:hypothetical protein
MLGEFIGKNPTDERFGARGFYRVRSWSSKQGRGLF